MIFSSLPALNGDAFVINDNSSTILIDGGTSNTYGQIIKNLGNKEPQAIFITHVDNDHIGGIINLILKSDINITNTNFYMNHPDLATRYTGSKVSYKEGDTLKSLLDLKGKQFNPVISGFQKKIGDFLITALSPTNDDHKELLVNWNASKIIKDSKTTYLTRQKNNGDIINKSSIVLLIEKNNKSILLLGDSHTDVVCTALREKGYSESTPIKLDLLKLSHHGSKNNIDSTLLNLIDCTDFYISTNGGRHNHPDHETIKLLSQKAVKSDAIFNVYLNYNIENKIIRKCTFKIENINFIYKNELVIK